MNIGRKCSCLLFLLVNKYIEQIEEYCFMFFLILFIIVVFEFCSNINNFKIKKIQSKSIISVHPFFRIMVLLVGGSLLYLSDDLNVKISICVVSILLYVIPMNLTKDTEKFGVDMCCIPVMLILILGHASYLLKPENISSSFFSFIMPHITACVGWVTFWAFWSQIRANALTVMNFKKEQVNGQYYEMLKVHENNVEKIEEKLPKGKDAGKQKGEPIDSANADFNILYKEVKVEIIKIIKEKAEKGNIKIDKYYSLLNNGKIINPPIPSEPYNVIANSTDKDEKIIWWFKLQQEILSNAYFYFYYGLNNDLSVHKKSRYDDKTDKFHIKFNINIYPKYCNLLTHYYRNLFQTVKFIVEQDESLFTYKAKRDKLRMLRAKLSNTEQLLLFYNWFSTYGKQWEDAWNKNVLKKNKGRKFLTDYRMIHNLNYKDLDETIFADFKNDDSEAENKHKKNLLIYLFNNLGSILGEEEDCNYPPKKEGDEDDLFEFEDW